MNTFLEGRSAFERHESDVFVNVAVGPPVGLTLRFPSLHPSECGGLAVEVPFVLRLEETLGPARLDRASIGCFPHLAGELRDELIEEFVGLPPGSLNDLEKRRFGSHSLLM